MRKIVLYHGSTNIVEHPHYGVGKPYNDYGKGFYCTKHIELAKEWACNGERDGYANRYELELSGLKVLNLSTEEYSILNWLAILMDNRMGRLSSPIETRGREYLLTHFLPNYKTYDVIVGYRADDSYFSFARAFVANGITLNQLKMAMKLGKLGEQYVLMSEKAFAQIKFLDYEVAKRDEYYSKRKVRDENARAAFKAELEKDAVEGIYMRDIIREEMEDSDERLQ